MNTMKSYQKSRLALICASSFILGGCFGGSSSSSDDPAEVQLSEEDQVIGAAVRGLSSAQTISSRAEGLTEGQDDPREDEGTNSTSFNAASSDSSGVVVGVSADEIPEDFSCAEGSYRIREDGEYLDINDDFDFPTEYFERSVPDTGSSRDTQIRTDCVIRDDDDDIIFSFDGALDVAQQEGIDGDGRAVALQVGGYSGDAPSDRPNLDEPLRFNGGSGFGSSATRIELFSCEGCKDGDLGDFSGDEALDVTSVSFGDLEFSGPGVNFKSRTGASREEPFVLQTALSDTGQDGAADVRLDGLLMFEDTETGCGYDVTYQTNEPLVVEGYEAGGTQTTGGEVEITSNESGNTYLIEFQSDGSLLVNGSAPPQPSSDAMECGYVAGNFSAGLPTNQDLAGTWALECDEQTSDGETVWINDTLTFEASGSATRETESFDDSSCSGDPENTLKLTFDYQIGSGIPSAVDQVAGVEINLFNRRSILNDGDESDSPDLFGSFGIGDDKLYWGERSISDSVQDELNPDFVFERR